MASSPEAENLQSQRGQFYVDLTKQLLRTTAKTPNGESFHGAIAGDVAYLHKVHQTPEHAVPQTGKKTRIFTYADRQFRKLFQCQKRIWKKLKSILVGEFRDPKPHKPTSRRLDDPLKKRIQSLRKQEYKLLKIAEMTNTPLTTVRRHATSQTPDPDATADET